MTHHMTLHITHPTGVTEWLCPVCGRRLVIQYDPYKMIVLDTGSEPTVTHTGAESLPGSNLGVDAMVEPHNKRLDVFSEFLDGKVSFS